MSLWVETIRAVDGELDTLDPHIERMMRTIHALLGIKAKLHLQAALARVQPKLGHGVWKVRVLYTAEIEHIEFAPYTRQPYRSAVLIDGSMVNYCHKWVNRTSVNILNTMAREAGADTALIVKDDGITDFTAANAAFFDGTTWWTPDRPLLKGTRRERLLAASQIRPATIRPADLHLFSLVSPINAMMELGEVTMPTSAIALLLPHTHGSCE